MELERAIETQRLRLLRLLAGLVVAVGFLSVGPVSRGFLIRACGYIGSVLSRAERAARYLVIAKARSFAAERGYELDTAYLLDASRLSARRNDGSLADCSARLRVVQAVLRDLPRQANRLLHKIEKQMRCGTRIADPHPDFEECLSASLAAWRLVGVRVERPPDTALRAADLISLPPVPGREPKVVGHCA